MRGQLLLVLLLSAGLVLADDEAEGGSTASAAEAQSQSNETKGEPEKAQGEKKETEGEAKEAQAQADKGPKLISGMSILGNQEAPKSLVIVPWKSSRIGDSIGISPMLDDSRLPVDKEVFMRSLRYYEIRSATKP